MSLSAELKHLRTSHEKVQQLMDIKAVQAISDASDEMAVSMNRGIAECFHVQQQIEQLTKQLMIVYSGGASGGDGVGEQVGRLSAVLKELGDVEAYLESIGYYVQLVQCTLSKVSNR